METWKDNTGTIAREYSSIIEKLRSGNIYGLPIDNLLEQKDFKSIVVAAYYMGFNDGVEDYKSGLRGL